MLLIENICNSHTVNKKTVKTIQAKLLDFVKSDFFTGIADNERERGSIKMELKIKT